MAQFANGSMGAKSISLGNVSSTISGYDALFNNPSMLIHQQKLPVLCASIQSRYVSADLSTANIAYAVPIKQSYLGVNIRRYGIKELSETGAILIYVQPLGFGYGISASLGVKQFRIKNYGSSYTPIFKLGMSGKLSDHIDYGILIQNFEELTVAESTILRSQMAIGVRNKIHDDLQLHVEIESHLGYGNNVKIGLEYQYDPKLNFRIGFSSNPAEMGMGFGFIHKSSYQIDCAVSYNILLGLSPALSFSHRLHQ